MITSVLIGLEQSLAAKDRLEESVRRNEELVALLREDRSLRHANEHFVLKNLHMSLVRLGRLDEALATARLARPLLEKAGRGPELLEPCALLLMGGRIDDAARMAGRGGASFTALDFRRDPVEHKLYDLLVLGLREARAPGDLARLMEEGRALGDAEAMRLAFGDAG
ncbi:MAG: hypothetical protein ABI330_21155 [Caldimonas sp.]